MFPAHTFMRPPHDQSTCSSRRRTGAQATGKCGKLRVSMYGTRDAAMNWATEYGETLKAAGYVQGKTSPCLFFHKGKNVTVMVHGDDFVAVGDPGHLESTKRRLVTNTTLRLRSWEAPRRTQRKYGF